MDTDSASRGQPPQDALLRGILRQWQPPEAASPWLERRVWHRIAATSPAPTHGAEEVLGWAVWRDLWAGLVRRTGLGGALLTACLPVAAGAVTGVLQARADGPAEYIASLRVNLTSAPAVLLRAPAAETTRPASVAPRDPP